MKPLLNVPAQGRLFAKNAKEQGTHFVGWQRDQEARATQRLIYFLSSIIKM
jgi:hypothetical protein